LGQHQLDNAALAIGVIEALKECGLKIRVTDIKAGLHNTRWPGRCEVISRRPLIVLDGAQNVASAQVLKDSVRNNFKFKKLILVLGICQDKDIKGICRELKTIADEVILTKADNPRATNPAVLAKFFKGKPIHITKNTREASKLAKQLAKKDDLILVTGSLFVVGAIRDEKI
jgi:dihydrofolate synthase/folylpolyglutamate synthase